MKTADALGRLKFSAEDVTTLRKLGEYRGMQELFTRQQPEVFDALNLVHESGKEMVRHVLRQMRDEGLLVAEGKGRGARWRKQTGEA